LNFPKLSQGLGKPEYYEFVKSSFVKENLKLEGRRLADQTGMTEKQYVDFKAQEESTRRLWDAQVLPDLEKLNAKREAHFVGNSKMAKKGFCGTSYKTNGLDVFVDNSGDIFLKPDKSDAKPDSFKGKFNELKVSDLDTVLKYQQTPEGRQKNWTQTRRHFCSSSRSKVPVCNGLPYRHIQRCQGTWQAQLLLQR
jgi:hypothetical protein